MQGNLTKGKRGIGASVGTQHRRGNGRKREREVREERKKRRKEGRGKPECKRVDRLLFFAYCTFLIKQRK